LALALPLQYPQAILVSQYRSPTILGFEFSLLFCRLWTGLLLGLTNINDFAILLDLYGASLQNSRPHQEIVVYDDPRRDGGGIGLWLGIWTWCWIGSISVGFLSGASIIYHLNPEWGFYITIIFMACVLVLNIIAPETRRSAHRKSFKDFVDHDENVRRKVARGEVRLHISDKGPRFWFQELWAGVILSKRMFFQRGFSVLSLYLGWIYGQNVLVIVVRFPNKYLPSSHPSIN
jgi:MFS family permease